MTEVDMLQTMAQMDILPEELDLTQPGVAEMALFSTMAPKVRSNPYPIYNRLRETDSLHLSPSGRALLTRHDDAVSVRHQRIVRDDGPGGR
jgi:hypothetical protein